MVPVSRTVVIIVSGPPCTGKTTIGRRIAGEFGLPFINKDGIKERLFDSLGWSDRQWSRRLGLASYSLLYYFVEAQLAAGRSHVVESNFAPAEATAQFGILALRYSFEPVQVMCRCDGDVLFERFKQRAEAGERHPGHVDHLAYAEFRETLLRGRLDALDIGGAVHEVDTTRFDDIDYAALFGSIAKRMAKVS